MASLLTKQSFFLPARSIAFNSGIARLSELCPTSVPVSHRLVAEPDPCTWRRRSVRGSVSEPSHRCARLPTNVRTNPKILQNVSPLFLLSYHAPWDSLLGRNLSCSCAQWHSYIWAYLGLHKIHWCPGKNKCEKLRSKISYISMCD